MNATQPFTCKGFAAAGLVVTVLAAIIFSAAPAYADKAAEQYDTWENGEGKCLRTYSEISDGVEHGGFTVSRPYAIREAFNGSFEVHCQTSWSRGTGQLGARADLWRWDARSGQWAFCIAPAWLYNDSPTAKIQQNVFHGRQCGDGWYGSSSAGVFWWDNTWKGGWVWSGYIHLPN